MDQNVCPECRILYSSTMKCGCSNKKESNRRYSKYDWERIQEIKEILKKCGEHVNPIDEHQNLNKTGCNLLPADIQRQIRTIACPDDIDPIYFQMEDIQTQSGPSTCSEVHSGNSQVEDVQRQMRPITFPIEVDPKNFQLEDIQIQSGPIECSGQVYSANLQLDDNRRRRGLFEGPGKINAANLQKEDFRRQNGLISYSGEIESSNFQLKYIQKQMRPITFPIEVDPDNFQLEDIQTQNREITCPKIETTNFQLKDIHRPIASPGENEASNFLLEDIQIQNGEIASEGEIEAPHFQLKDIPRQRKPSTCPEDDPSKNAAFVKRVENPLENVGFDFPSECKILMTSYLDKLKMGGNCFIPGKCKKVDVADSCIGYRPEDESNFSTATPASKPSKISSEISISKQKGPITCSGEVFSDNFQLEDIQRPISSPGEIEASNFLLEDNPRQRKPSTCPEDDPSTNAAFIKRVENPLENVGFDISSEFEILMTSYLNKLKGDGNCFISSKCKKVDVADSCIGYRPEDESNFSTATPASKPSKISSEFSLSKKHSYTERLGEIITKCNFQQEVFTREKEEFCFSCKTRFCSSSSLKVHIECYLLHIPYVCGICKKRLWLLCGLENHLRFHSETFTLKCDVCDEEFVVLNTLAKHRRTHDS